MGDLLNWAIGWVLWIWSFTWVQSDVLLVALLVIIAFLLLMDR
jgi:hypothetical protein